MAFLEVGQTAGTTVAVKTPSTFQVNIYDESAPDSGRDLTGLMHKQTIVTKRTISLSWTNLSREDCADLLSAFMSYEYFYVKYFDPTNYDPQNPTPVTKCFYLGDRSSPLYNWALGIYSSLSFNIIER